MDFRFIYVFFFLIFSVVFCSPANYNKFNQYHKQIKPNPTPSPNNVRIPFKRQTNINFDQALDAQKPAAYPQQDQLETLPGGQQQQDELKNPAKEPHQDQDLIDHGGFDQQIEVTTPKYKPPPPTPPQQQEQQRPEPAKGGPSKGGPGEDEQTIEAAGLTPDDEHPRGEPFAFAYNVNDDNGIESHSRKEESDGEVVKGEYRVLMPDGRTQIVEYTADWKNGYRANVRYEPEIPTITAPPPIKRPPPSKGGPGEDETDIQPGGFTPKPNDCVPDAKGYTKGTNCPTPAPPVKKPPGREDEEDIQPGGFTPKPKPVDDCIPDAKGSYGGAKGSASASASAGTNCPPVKKPIREDEEDIQPGGYTPKPKEQATEPPSGLYGAPNTPFEVRQHPKFGYNYEPPNPPWDYVNPNTKDDQQQQEPQKGQIKQPQQQEPQKGQVKQQVQDQQVQQQQQTQDLEGQKTTVTCELVMVNQGRGVNRRKSYYYMC